MRFVTLNISAPSAARAGRLLEFLPSLEADVLVLTETRQNRGPQSFSALSRIGICGCRRAVDGRVRTRGRRHSACWTARSAGVRPDHRGATSIGGFRGVC